MIENELFLDGKKLPGKLPKQELINLFEKVYSGDKKAKNKIIEHNIRLVLYQVEKRFKNIDHDKKDLVSIGIIGLIKAIDNFDVTKNIAFASFATRCIDNEILMYLRKIKKFQNVELFDDVINMDKDGNELKINDILKDENINIEEEYGQKEYKKQCIDKLYKIIDSLQDRDKEIIIMCFGLLGNKAHTQYEVSQKLGISQSYVSRMVKRILNDMKQMIDDDNIGLERKNIQRNVNSKKIESKDKLLLDFPGYTKEEIIQAAKKITGMKKEVFYLVYGLEDGNPLSYSKIMEKLNLTYKNTTQGFYNAKKEVIENLSNLKNKKDNTRNIKVEETINSEVMSQEVETDKQNLNKKDDITYKDSDVQNEIKPVYKDADNETQIKFIPKEFNIPTLSNFSENKENFRVLINLLSNPTQQVILLLSLGYVEDRCYSVDEISKLLGFEKEKVIEIINDGLSNITGFTSLTLNGVESARKQLRIRF